MPQSAQQIVIGANGKVLVAPTGTAGPVDHVAAWPTGWIDLGFMSEDGVTFRNGKTTERVNVWQMFNAARYYVTEEDINANFVMRQWSKDTVPLAFGGGTVTQVPSSVGPPAVAAHTLYEPPAAGTIDERAVGIEWVDGAYTVRLILKKTMVTDAVETTIAKAGPSDLPVTVGVMGVDGSLPWYFRTNLPGLAAA